MKVILKKKTYNTETAKELHSFSEGAFGDPDGYEEILYKTPRGDHFIFGRGGETSKYAEESITPLTAKEAEKWIEEHNV